jgi:hypothetical protein
MSNLSIYLCACVVDLQCMPLHASALAVLSDLHLQFARTAILPLLPPSWHPPQPSSDPQEKARGGEWRLRVTQDLAVHLKARTSWLLTLVRPSIEAMRVGMCLVAMQYCPPALRCCGACVYLHEASILLCRHYPTLLWLQTPVQCAPVKALVKSCTFKPGSTALMERERETTLTPRAARGHAASGAASG